MTIKIKVSEKTEQKIRVQAAKTGQEVDEVVGNLVEEVWDEHFPENAPDPENGKYKNPFEPFIGMFSSGKTDTSERMHEILYDEDLDPAQGFGTDK